MGGKMKPFKADFFNDFDIHFYLADGNIFFPTFQLTKPLGFLTEGQLGLSISKNKIITVDAHIGQPTYISKTMCQMISLYQVERFANIIKEFPIAKEFVSWAKQRAPITPDTQTKKVKVWEKLCLKPAFCRMYKNIPVAFFRDENTGVLYITDYNFALIIKQFELALHFKNSVLPENFDRKEGKTPLADFVDDTLFFSEYYVFILLDYISHIKVASEFTEWLFHELEYYRKLYTSLVDFPPVNEHLCEYFEKGSGIDKDKIYHMSKKKEVS
jgi:hypothetical protein